MRQLITPGVGTIVSPENDPAALADVLDSYLGHENRRAREGKAARTLTERTYSAPAVAEHIEHLLTARLGVLRARRWPPPETSPQAQINRLRRWSARQGCDKSREV